MSPSISPLKQRGTRTKRHTEAFAKVVPAWSKPSAEGPRAGSGRLPSSFSCSVVKAEVAHFQACSARRSTVSWEIRLDAPPSDSPHNLAE
jgi:hypothetical protein